MPFKIIQTLENGKVVLTIVPSAWEQKGILSWPVKRNDIRLIHDGDSVPNPNWKKSSCVKKREFLTLKEAEREQEMMEQVSDTDDTEPVHSASASRAKGQLLSTRVLHAMDFNDQIVTQEFARENDMAGGENNLQEGISIPSEPVVITLEGSGAAIQSETENYVQSTDSEVLIQLLTNQQQLLANQDVIRQQLAILQSSVDFLMANGISNVSKSKPDEEQRIPFNQIQTVKELDDFEFKLKDESFYNDIINKMSFICGTSGKMKGTDSCYKLIDYFFNREFFLLVNWTGSTRDTTTEKKTPLKYYYKVRNCFFDIVRKSDSNFTENECEKFFKVIIKNAKARLSNKINSVSRSSKSREKKTQETIPEEERENIEPLPEIVEVNSSTLDVENSPAAPQ